MTGCKPGVPHRYPETRAPIGPENRDSNGLVRMRPITKARRELFLKELALHGNVSEASRVASPHCVGKNAPIGGFQALRRRDPEFRKQWDAAIEQADSRLEVEAVRRAVTGTARYVIGKGNVVRHPKTGEPLEYVEYSDRLLEILLKARLPRYQEKRQLDVNHRVAESGLAVLQVEDLMCLNDGEKKDLYGILSKIASHRKSRGTDQDSEFGGEIYDADWEPVEEPEALPAPDETNRLPLDGLSDDEREELEFIAS